MTQREKDFLLLVDLSVRLPYRVMVLADTDKTFDGGVISRLNSIDIRKDIVIIDNVLTPFHIGEVRPYLRPMSSMTEEESKEFALLQTAIDMIDWLNAHHFDYRGLIPMGLAIEAPEGMYKC